MCGFLCIFRAFPVCVLCSCVFSFLQSLPPPPFFRSNSFRCSIAYSMLSLCVPLFLLYPSFLSRYLLLFYSLCPSLLSFLCVRLLTHALYFPCVPFVPVLLPLCRPFCPSFSVLGLSVPLVRVFSLVAPTFPVPFPLFPAAFPSSSSFVPAFSFPFSPLFSSPSFSIKKKVFP